SSPACAGGAPKGSRARSPRRAYTGSPSASPFSCFLAHRAGMPEAAGARVAAPESDLGGGHDRRLLVVTHHGVRRVLDDELQLVESLQVANELRPDEPRAIGQAP